jgi:hypothetical protein
MEKDPAFDQERIWSDQAKKIDELWQETERVTFNPSTGPSVDTVNHPPHYKSRAMEAIDIIEMIIETEKNPKVSYNLSNVLKYILRFRDKGKPEEDLKKAQWYLARALKHVSEE